MKTSSLLETAHYFWKQFDAFEQTRQVAGEPRNESLRHRCALGFLGLDAALNLYWREIVMPEWGELLMYINSTLEEATGLAKMAEATAPEFNRAQWIASLRFIHNTGEPERFSPSVVDVALVLALKSSSRMTDPAFSDSVRLLLRLQKLRNHCMHTGKDWSETIGFEALRLLQDFSKRAEAIHPILADAIHVRRDRQGERAA